MLPTTLSENVHVRTKVAILAEHKGGHVPGFLNIFQKGSEQDIYI